MQSLPRFLALSLALLLVLLLAALGAQVWLRQEEKQARDLARRDAEVRLQAAIELTGGTSAGWDEARLNVIQRLTGIAPAVANAPPGFAAAEGVWLRFEARRSPASRLVVLYQRVLLALGLLGGVLLVALLASMLFGRRGGLSEGTRSPFSTSRDVLSLAHLARTSVHQQQELDRERDERLRAEAEARVRLQLLNRSLEEKIRIGRDLHDGVIQSLYAAGLTLQSAQPIAATDPAEAGRRVETTLDMINRTIAEIRAYITGLSPLSVRGRSVAGALQDVVEELRAGREVHFDVQIDESAAAALSDAQMSDTLQIAREAISNALRHGEAAEVSVRLHAADDGVHLHVHDNGRGFEPTVLTRTGHGLANMRARAEGGGGRLAIDSATGHGTRLWLFWPDARHA